MSGRRRDNTKAIPPRKGWVLMHNAPSGPVAWVRWFAHGQDEAFTSHTFRLDDAICFDAVMAQTVQAIFPGDYTAVPVTQESERKAT